MSAQNDRHNHDVDESAVDDRYHFGFWIYILTDILLFGAFFATYAVLRPATFGNPGPAELFSLPFVAIETALLLTSSFTFGLVMYSKQRKNVAQTILWMSITFLLGAGFVGMEIHEFSHLINIGQGPQTNAFLSGFFGLVGLHGLHVSGGLIWMGTLLYQIRIFGLTPRFNRKLGNLSLFWHFLDIIWIFVFTFVYLMGAI